MIQYTEEELCNTKVIHRTITKPPTVLTHAEGVYIYCQDGTKLLDAIGGAAVVSVGHNNREVINAIITQMNQITYSFNVDFTIPIIEEFAKYLIQGYEDKIAKVYFANLGSEANENALKLATQYWYELGKTKKNQFISRNQSYHGNCVATVSLSGNKLKIKPYEGIIDKNRFHKVSPCFEFRYKKQHESSDEYTQRVINELEKKILEIGPENIAAFFAETVVGATSGAVPATKGYFVGVRELCDKYDILMICDEVMCGSGRSGAWFTWEQEGIVPDITTAGKSISGGYSPLSCVYINHKILDVLTNGSGVHNTLHTFQNFSLSCAAGYAVQKIIRRENLLQNVKDMGEYLMRQLKEKVLKYDIVVDVRGKGLFQGVEFAKDKETKIPFDPEMNVAIRIGELIKKHGALVYSGKGTIDGDTGDHILVAPSFTITKEEVDLIVDAIASAVKEFQREENL